MANDQKKAGFFSSFRKRALSDNSGVVSRPEAPSAPQAPPPPPAPAPAPNRTVKPEAQGAAPDSSLSSVDTVAAFKVLCQSLAEISVSQLKVLEMVLTMLSGSLNKIAGGSKTDKAG